MVLLLGLLGALRRHTEVFLFVLQVTPAVTVISQQIVLESDAVAELVTMETESMSQ